MHTAGEGPRKVLVDARWLGIGGPGRVTEHLLRGLAGLELPGEWVLWGDESVDAHLWSGARRVPSRHHPHTMFGQREIPGPRSEHADVAYFPHQMRPLWRIARREVTTIHDTIPFRFPPNPRLARAMRIYLRRMARLSHIVATVSLFSRDCLMRDLHLEDEKIVVTSNPIDHDSARRVRAMRAITSPEPVAIYLGADLPHKNLDRLLTAFARTRFQSAGGRLALVGMDERSLSRLSTVARAQGAAIEPLGRLPQDDLERLFARATLLVQPSLEEGFGLPVAEALAAGIPVAVSNGGSLPEITQGLTPTFDPEDVSEIARAIDEAIDSPPVESPTWITPAEFATAAYGAILRAHHRVVTG